MQQIMKYALPSVLIVIAAVVGTLTMPASAQSSTGQFNPQTQFAVGSKLQITSIYGLETTPPPFPTLNRAGLNYENRNGELTVKTEA